MEALAPGRRRAARPVAEQLLGAGENEAHRFDFLQAVRLLEVLARREAMGRGEAPPAEAVRFRSRVSMAFPASDVAGAEPPARAGGPFRMTVDFLGLAGVTGPLPRPLAEGVLARAARGDTAARAFLDLFNHRLVALMYAARKRHRPALATTAADEAPLSGALFALAGLGTAGTRGRLAASGVDDRTLLGYAGLLAGRPRSMAGLETMLEDHFGVPVRGRQLRGRWIELEPEERTRIGHAAGTHHALGRTAALGGRMWDQAAAFEVEAGPLPEARFRDFLPTGSAFRPLCALVRFWVGVELEFTVRLVVRAAEVPETKLGGGARLGWSSWLKTRPAADDDRQVVLDENERVPPVRVFAGWLAPPAPEDLAAAAAGAP